MDEKRNEGAQGVQEAGFRVKQPVVGWWGVTQDDWCNACILNRVENKT